MRENVRPKSKTKPNIDCAQGYSDIKNWYREEEKPDREGKEGVSNAITRRSASRVKVRLGIRRGGSGFAALPQYHTRSSAQLPSIVSNKLSLFITFKNPELGLDDREHYIS